MKKTRLYRLQIGDTRKELYLLHKLLEQQFANNSPLNNIKKARKIIYVATSQSKIRRLKEHLRTSNNILLSPKFVTIWHLFDLLYDIIPLGMKAPKHKITDAYANIIIRHILLDRKKNLFPSRDFSLSPETSDFFLEWLKKIKEYNLHLKYREGEIKYRKDAPLFDLTNKENRFNERLLSALKNVFNEYQSFLKHNDLVDESDRRWWVIDHLKPNILKKYDFYIEHLSILRIIEQHLFKKIYRQAHSVSLLDFDFPFPCTQFTTTGIIEMEKKVIEVESTNKEFAPEIKFHTYEKKEHEVEGIAKIVNREGLDKKIVIISPAVDEYEKTFERIFPQYYIQLPSLSQKLLSEFPIIKTCLAIFEIINRHLTRKSVVNFLLSPYVKLLQEKEKRLTDIKTREHMIVSGDDWKRLKDKGTEMRTVSNFVGQLRLLESKTGLSFINTYLSLLQLIINVENEDDIKPYNNFIKFITSFKREPIVKTISSFRIKDFQNLFLFGTNSVKLNTGKTLNEQVEELNIEETGGMNFSRIFLIGLTEDKLPRKPKHNPLFSEKLLEEMNFPTYDMLYALSKFNFESTKKSAKQVFLSYFRKDEKGNIFLKSPFLRNIARKEEIAVEDNIDTLSEWQMRISEIIHRVKDVNHSSLNQDMRKRALLIREGIKRITDVGRLKNVKKILETEKQFSDYAKDRINQLSKGISPFALETYGTCPYNFFLNYVLRIGEVEEPEKDMDNLLRGKVIHRILAEFYSRKLAKTIGKNIVNDWKELKSIALNAIDEMVPKTRDRILLRLEFVSNELDPLLKKFLKNEVKTNLGHIVEDVEWEFTGKDVSIEKNGERLGFVGRIDRIDRNRSGLVIFDYKTGNKDYLPSEKKIEEGGSFQFPIYSFAVEKCIGKVSKTAYYVLNSKDGAVLEERQSTSNEVFISNVFSVWKKIRKLEFEPKSGSFCITRCPFNELCPETG